MKKKILLISLLAMLFVCIFAISVNAAVIKLETDPGLDCDDSLVSTLDYEAFNNSTATDKESKVVMTDGTYFYVFPAYYVFTTNSNFQPTLENINAAMKSADTSITDDVFTDKKVNYVRIELPTWISDITQGTGKLEGWTGIKEFRFGTTLTKISAHNAFTNCSNLEFVSDFSHITAMGNATFSGCTKLKIDVVWPSAITYVPTQTFSGCSALKSVTFTAPVTSVGSWGFGECSSLKELVFPNGLVSIGKHAFGGCSKLEKIVLGDKFTTISSTNSDYESFSGCNNLKFIYLPETFADAIKATNGNYKSIFPQSSKTIYFITCNDYDTVAAIQNKFIATNANSNIAGASIELYDSTKNYNEYQTTLKTSVIVYGYYVCDAFYNGAHQMKEAEYRFAGTEYFSEFHSYTGCDNCAYVEDVMISDALFTKKGITAPENAEQPAICHAITVNPNAIDAYNAYLGESNAIKYGVVVGKATESGTPVNAQGTSSGDAIVVGFEGTNYSFIQAKITNVPAETGLYCSAYVIDAGVVTYLYEGSASTTAQVISLSTYNPTLPEATVPSNDEE
ncbi:MAG: leucine-rich repeat domain-containing protein [Clostridia bacterium]|nr:leucine-rich repeat domain-containing protein [Clostridia bacterium]